MTATISPHELHQRITAGGTHDLVDVRMPGEFAAFHATGAVNHPLDRLDPAAVIRSRRGAADAPIYLLCLGGSRASTAAERFAALGMANTVVVEGGTRAWREAGLPTVVGKGAISLDRQVRIVAGALVATGCVLGFAVTPWWHLLSGFVGGGLVFAGITDICGMGLLLARMPWNRAPAAPPKAAPCCGPTPTP